MPSEDPPLSWVYACLPPHESESVTGPGQVGVAFSAHEAVDYRSGSHRGTASYPGGSVICSGGDPIVWSRVRQSTEALEIYPDPRLLADVAGDSVWPVDLPVMGRQDPVVVGIASILRRTEVTDGYLSDVAQSTLAHRLVVHIVTEYAGRSLSTESRTRRPTLSPQNLATVGEFVEAELSSQITLERLAATVHLSQFHFARAFKESVGLAPHQFVLSRRMDRARHELRTTTRPVDAIARDLGIVNMGHFRRVFVAHVGVTPAVYRSLAA